MLRDAVKIVSHTLEPEYGVIKLKAEANESYPSDNCDWAKSGLYTQILGKYKAEKERIANDVENKTASKGSKV